MTKHGSISKIAGILAREHRRVVELTAQVAEFEKRAEAETFLLELAGDPGTPVNLRPTTIEDFMSKRASLEGTDIGTAKLATKMASSPEGFDIGDAESKEPLFQNSESPAEDFFTEYLLTSQG